MVDAESGSYLRTVPPFLAEAQVIMTDFPGDSGRIAGAPIPRWQIRIQEKGSRQDEK